MHDDRWVWPERRDLYRACSTLADPQATSAHVSEAASTLLNEIELYDDPRQGKGLWLFPDESLVADDLAAKLHALAGAETSGDWGEAITGHSTWPDICADAQKLVGMIRHNGQGTAQKVR
ncbi:hypothetical protein [Sphingomonas trueperi]|uniref:hypothetical protein n=1 Tax=Sphingomonas trueperi TaxID=53317 RepID=UPI0011C3F8A8